MGFDGECAGPGSAEQTASNKKREEGWRLSFIKTLPLESQTGNYENGYVGKDYGDYENENDYDDDDDDYDGLLCPNSGLIFFICASHQSHAQHRFPSLRHLPYSSPQICRTPNQNLLGRQKVRHPSLEIWSGPKK